MLIRTINNTVVASLCVFAITMYPAIDALDALASVDGWRIVLVAACMASLTLSLAMMALARKIERRHER